MALLDWLRAWLELLSQLFGPTSKRRARPPLPWRLYAGNSSRPAALKTSDIERLLKRHRDLKDIDKLAGVAARFRTPESDFFADPAQVERLLQRFLEEDPPWLHLARVLSGGEQGEGSGQEVLWRERETREVQDVTLFVPDETWRDLPLASMTMRPARNLQEVWQARLLDQVLPPEVLVDRMSRGEVLVPVRSRTRQRLEFKPERRRMEVITRKPVPIPIDVEGGSGKGGQLLYFLLDYSASMQGKSAVLALAVIAATLRANMGRGDTRYLFRRYAQEEAIWPREVEYPLQARSVAEKDRLLDIILTTDFNGGATHVNHAFDVATNDIENLRRQEQLEAEILLVTDGRAEMLESTRLRLLRANIKVHTVMVTPERNPSLEALSESFTALDIHPDLPQGQPAGNTGLEPPAAQTLRSFHI